MQQKSGKRLHQMVMNHKVLVAFSAPKFQVCKRFDIAKFSSYGSENKIIAGWLQIVKNNGGRRRWGKKTNEKIITRTSNRIQVNGREQNVKRKKYVKHDKDGAMVSNNLTVLLINVYRVQGHRWKQCGTQCGFIIVVRVEHGVNLMRFTFNIFTLTTAYSTTYNHTYFITTPLFCQGFLH